MCERGERWQIAKSRGYLPGIVASTELGAGRQQRANRDDRTLGFRSSQSAWGRPGQKTRLDVSSPSTFRVYPDPSQLESFRLRFVLDMIFANIPRFIVLRENVIFVRAPFVRYNSRILSRNVIAKPLCSLITIRCHTWTDIRFPF